MTDPARDKYSVYYADKLWQLLPAVYRVLDTDQLGANGPLREMVNRIGATTAVLRQSIDRLWDNQSIETCDDWVIPSAASWSARGWCRGSTPAASAWTSPTPSPTGAARARSACSNSSPTTS